MVASAFLLLASLAVAGLMTSLGRSEPRTLRLAIGVWPGYEPLMIARRDGRLESSQVRLVELAGITQVIQEFEAGRVDAATLTLDEALMMLEKGIDVRLLIATDVSAGANALIGRPDVTSARALAGRRVGVESVGMGAFFLARALDVAGLTARDIHSVELAADKHEAALRDGTVDAVVTYEPIVSKLIADGAKKLFDSSEIPGELVDVIVVHAKAISQHRSSIEQLAEAWFYGVGTFRSDPAESVRKMAYDRNQDAITLRDAFQGIHLFSCSEHREYFTNSANGIHAAAEMMSARLEAIGFLTHDLAVERLFDPALRAAAGQC